MTSTLPAHLSVAIKRRITLLREVWDVDEVFAQAQPRLKDYPVAHRRRQPADPRVGAPTFPQPRNGRVRSAS